MLYINSLVKARKQTKANYRFTKIYIHCKYIVKDTRVCFSRIFKFKNEIYLYKLLKYSNWINKVSKGTIT